MDLIEKMVLPQSEQHILLLKYMLTLAYMIFIPYMALLFGSLLNSLYIKTESDDQSATLRFEIIKSITFNRISSIGFGIVPFLSIQFVYLQLLQKSVVSFAGMSVFILILFTLSIILIYLFKHYFALSLLLNEKTNLQEESNSLVDSFYKPVMNYRKYGKYAFILLSVTLYLFFGLVNYISDYTNWDSGYLNNLISTKTAIDFIFFIIISLIISNSFVLWKIFKSEGKSYPSDFANLLSKTSLVLTLILPALILLNTFLTSEKSLSNDYFIYTLIAIAIVMILTNFYYKNIKDQKFANANMIIFLIFIFIMFNIIREQYLFGTNLQVHTQKLAENYIEYQNKLNAELGINVVKVSGEEIFNGKCIACHNFDKKIVGPAYKDVLPKYEGKVQDLIKFVLNPVKVNPDFPAMPNQGLKPNEAEAIADYILKTYTEKYK